VPQFPSPEWMDAFSEELVAQPGSAEVAEVLDGVYRFVVEPAGPLRERHAYDVLITPADGSAHAERLDEPAASPRLTLTADHDRWKQLITGRLDVKMALLMRRLRIKGDVAPLVSGLSSAAPLMRALGAVDTQWR
jgi:hypothetical protein